MSNKVKVCVSCNNISPYLTISSPKEAVALIGEHFQNDLDKFVWPHDTDLLVMTECCDRYLAKSADELYAYYEERKDTFREFFASEAKKHHAYIAYNAVLKLDGIWRNATEIYDRQGESMGFYFKNHLFPGEYQRGTVAGTELPVFECDFGKVVCATCFDLNFEELRHRCRDLHPDIIAFSSAFHGGLLQKMWAYESRAYFAGACSKAPEILDPQGESIAHSHNIFYNPVAVAELNLDREIIHLDYNMTKFPKIKAKYGNKVNIRIPDYLGSALMTCEADDLTIRDIIDEFKLVTLDEYLDDCLSKREEHLKHYR